METKRCPRCNKLLRIDTPSCPRCGTVVSGGKVTRKSSTSTFDSEPGLLPSRPTHPPASPHRAGHYSGLHPEDQPFLSSFFIPVQRPPLLEAVAEEEPQLAEIGEGEPDKDIAGEEIAIEDQETLPQGVLWSENEVESEALSEDEDEPFISNAEGENEQAVRNVHELQPVSTPLPALQRPEPASRESLASLLITGALLFFLLASGLLVFLFIGKPGASPARPRLIAAPQTLRVGDTLLLTASGFTAHHAILLLRDQQTKIVDAQGAQLMPTTDAQGTFALHLPITAAWQAGVHSLLARDGNLTASSTLTVQAAPAGPPVLHLDTAQVDLGTGAPGSLSQKNITLNNSGGGEVHWQAQSNVDWLTLTPTIGSFAGSQVVGLTVNRGNLAPRNYSGKITFTQDDGGSQTLDVTMAVDTTPVSMVLSDISLTFTGSTVQSPDAQKLVIQNTGDQAFNWTAESITPENGKWLSVTPAQGLLNPDTSAVLMVNVSSKGLDAGIYQGSLDFSNDAGSLQQVAVTLTINPPPQAKIQLSPQSLNFTSDQNVNPAAQSFTLTNPGGAPLNWQLQKDDNAQLYLNVAPASGTVAAGQSVTVTVTPALGLASGTITSTLTIMDSDKDTPVASQALKVTLTIAPRPILVMLTGDLHFDHDSTTTDTSSLIILNNTGSLPANWSITVPTQVTNWLSLSSTSGTLPPSSANSMAYINARCVSSRLKPGTYTARLTVTDTDSGTVSAPQTINVTLVVS